MLRFAALWLALLLTALFLFPAPREEEDALSDCAPTADFIALHPGVLVGRPDFTGLAPWALEEVTARDVGGPGDRNRSHWHRDDSALDERPIGQVDYLNSGMSRGHLNAAANHTRTQAAVDATHSYANCIPQEQSVNAGAWERTEARKRELAKQGAKVRSVTVPIFKLQPAVVADAGCPLWSLKVSAQGPHQVWRPTHLATSIRAELDGRVTLENYLIANSADAQVRIIRAGDDIEAHRVTCDEIERLTNLNLWPAPPRLKGRARERWLQQQEEREAAR
jgi:DNA/RNA endonuclease G (NUC1)